MYLTIFLSLIFSVNAWAGEKAITTDAENYTAVGYSENSSEQLAKQDACNAARRELIGYIFGAAYQINQNMVKSLGVLDYSQDVAVNSGEIILRGATPETSTIHGTTKCTITYPVEEAKLEKDRLKSAKNSKSVQFTDIGDTADARGGALEIVTIPEGADVYIDNSRWGITPLRLNGKLNTGTHLLRLEHDSYKVIEEPVVIGASKARVDKIMKRATGKLSISTYPTAAMVKINGQEIGHSPIGDIELLAGQKLKIETEHPEADSYSQTIRLSRDENKILDLKLPLKPAFISVNVDPSDAVITLENSSKISINHWTQVEPGSHQILVSKDGYEDQKLTVEIHGNERKAVPTIVLTPMAEMKKRELDKERYLYNPPWRFLSGMAFSGSTASNAPDIGARTCCAGWEIGFERKFFDTVGFTAKAAWIADMSDSSSSSSSSTTRSQSTQRSEISLGIPFYFDRAFYVGPELGRSNGSYTLTSGTVSVKQVFYGLSTGVAGTFYGSLGGYFNVGFRKYLDDGAYQGAGTYIINLGLLIGF